MKADRMVILMTGAGAPGARGTEYALRAGAGAQGIDLKIVGTDKNPDVAAKEFCDVVEPIPSPQSPRYAEALEEICRKHGVDAIVPQTTMEIEWLSENAPQIDYAEVMVNDRASIELANHKVETTRVFERLGLGFPEYFGTRDRAGFVAACEALGYPAKRVVVKMPVSNGMRGLRILNHEPNSFERFANEKPSGMDCTLEQMLAILETAPVWPELMVCEYLEGDEYSVDCYAGAAGFMAIPRKRDVIRTGISFVTTLERNEVMIEACRQAAEAMKLRGVFGFQFKMQAGVPKILECNPRIQGTMIAALSTGNNLIWAAVADLFGGRVPPVQLNHDWSAGRCYRYWGAVIEGQDGRVDRI